MPAAPAPPEAASRYYAASAVVANRAAAEAVRVRPRGLRFAWEILARGQIRQAVLADDAVDVMLLEQEIDVAAEALLNSSAFATSLTTFEQMAEGIAASQEDEFARLVASLTQDAGRAAESVAIAARPNIGHVRHLVLPSCSRCVILAGRVYRYSDGFERHPGCDCVMIPTTLANDELTYDPVDLMERGLVRGLPKADQKAILAGADFNKVVNVRAKAAGLTESGRVLSRSGKMTPEAIFRAAGDDRDALTELLESNGYVNLSTRSTPSTRSGDASGGGTPPPPTRPTPTPEPDPEDWAARQDALEGDQFTASGETLEPDEVRFAERMINDLGQRISWIPTGSNDSDEIGTLPTNDFIWHTSAEFDPSLPAALLVEHKSLRPSTPVDAKHIARQIAKATAKNKRRLIVTSVVIDVGDRAVAPAELAALQDYNRTAERKVERLWVMTRGQLVRVPLNE